MWSTSEKPAVLGALSRLRTKSLQMISASMPVLGCPAVEGSRLLYQKNPPQHSTTTTPVSILPQRVSSGILRVGLLLALGSSSVMTAG